MNLKKLLVNLAICGLSLSTVNLAIADQKTDELKQKLSSFLKADINDVKASEFKGFYEFSVGNDIFYTDPEMNYLIRGEVVDLKQKVNLSEKSFRELSQKVFASLPLEKALKIVKGSGKHKLVVFSDPDCPFCKKLEKDLVNLKDTTVYVFLTPIVQLHKDALIHSKQIICSANPEKAWVNYLTKDAGISSKSKQDCEKTKDIDDTLKLATQLGITGTPTIFFETGMRVPGAVPVKEIQGYLEKIEQSKAGK